MINTIAAGIASTGTLTSTTLGTEKNLANTQIVAATVTANLQAYYANNGVTVAAPPFVEWVDQTNSGILPQRLAPVTGLSFSALTTATPGQVTTSNVVTIAGAGTGVYVKVAASSGATIIKNGVAVDGQLAIARDGDTLALQVTAPGYNLGISLTLDVGSTSAQWKVASIPLGGTISGVTGTGLTLQDNAGDIITLTAGSTTFGFPAAIANGQPYSISVLTAPTSPLEACVVNNGAGTVGAAMVQIGVTCFAATELALTANLDSSNNGSISVYAIDPASGALNAVPGSPFATGSGVHSMAVDASGTYVIDANEGLGGISVYAINKATGSLALVSGSPFATGPNPSGTTVYNHGNFAFVVTSDSNLSVYSINDSTGALTTVGGSPFAIPQTIVCCGAYSQLRPLSNPAIDQTGGYVYLTWNNISIAAPSAGLIGFSINPVDGSLALLPGFPDLAAVGSVSGPPQSLVVAPNGNFAYSPEANVFSIDAATGAIGGGGSGSYEGQGSVAIAPNGLVAFTTTPAQGPGTIGAVMTYLVNPTTGALTPVSGSPFATGGYNPASAAVDLTGTYVLVSGASGGAGIISGFTINPASGYLTPMLGSPFTVGLANAFPNGIAFAPIP